MGRILLVVIAIGALGCGGGDPPGTPDAGATPDGRPSELGGDRPVSVQAPAVLEPGRSYPLVLVLHGYGASGFLQTAFLGLSGWPTERGAILLAPDGTPNSDGTRFWNASPACCDFEDTGVDDVAYLGGLIDEAIATYPVDPARVFLVGHSNGAYMAYRLACERADVVAAIGGLAGAATSLDGSSCNPARPVNVVHLHGTEDADVEYAGGFNGDAEYPGAVESVRQWRVHNGCTGEGEEVAARYDFDVTVGGVETAVKAAIGCPAEGAVELWTMNGSGHVPVMRPDFAATLWAWFDAHHR
jgi:polyhydroxybutyrate depolymerase